MALLDKKKIFTSKITLWCGIVFISCIKSKCASSTVPYIRIFFVSSVLWCQFLKIPFSEAWNKMCVEKAKKNCRFLQFYVKPTYSTSLNALPSHFLYILQLYVFSWSISTKITSLEFCIEVLYIVFWSLIFWKLFIGHNFRNCEEWTQ